MSIDTAPISLNPTPQPVTRAQLLSVIRDHTFPLSRIAEVGMTYSSVSSTFRPIVNAIQIKPLLVNHLADTLHTHSRPCIKFLLKSLASDTFSRACTLSGLTAICLISFTLSSPPTLEDFSRIFITSLAASALAEVLLRTWSVLPASTTQENINSVHNFALLSSQLAQFLKNNSNLISDLGASILVVFLALHVGLYPSEWSKFSILEWCVMSMLLVCVSANQASHLVNDLTKLFDCVEKAYRAQLVLEHILNRSIDFQSARDDVLRKDIQPHYDALDEELKRLLSLIKHSADDYKRHKITRNELLNEDRLEREKENSFFKTWSETLFTSRYPVTEEVLEERKRVQLQNIQDQLTECTRSLAWHEQLLSQLHSLDEQRKQNLKVLIKHEKAVTKFQNNIALLELGNFATYKARSLLKSKQVSQETLQEGTISKLIQDFASNILSKPITRMMLNTCGTPLLIAVLNLFTEQKELLVTRAFYFKKLSEITAIATFYLSWFQFHKTYSQDAIEHEASLPLERSLLIKLATKNGGRNACLLLTNGAAQLEESLKTDETLVTRLEIFADGLSKVGLSLGFVDHQVQKAIDATIVSLRFVKQRLTDPEFNGGDAHIGQQIQPEEAQRTNREENLSLSYLNRITQRLWETSSPEHLSSGIYITEAVPFYTSDSVRELEL